MLSTGDMLMLSLWFCTVFTLCCADCFTAIYNFVGGEEPKLSLDVGDAVNIICQSDGS